MSSISILEWISDLAKDNLKLTRIILGLKFLSDTDEDRILVGRNAVLSGK